MRTPRICNGGIGPRYLPMLAGCLLAALYLMFPDLAFAASPPTGGGGTSAGFSGLCTVYDNLSGGVASGVATLGVAAVGVGATLGKISSGLAVTVAVGIALMFGAAEIASMLGGSC